MSELIDDKELKLINDSLCALADHFEKKGQRFILAWALFDKDPEVMRMKGNLIATKALPHDYLSATANWTCMAIEAMTGRRHE